MKTLKNILINAFAQTGISPNETQLDQLSDYYSLLIEYNERFNLTAITDKTEAAVKHFADSAFLLSFLPDKQLTGRLIDVGSGAGFPGMVLGILSPQTQIVLLESNVKKSGFLNEVKQRLDLRNTSVICTRAEDAGQNSLYRECFDHAVARAVASLAVLMEYCSPFLKTGGRFIAYKGNISDDEMEQGCSAAQILQMKSAGSDQYVLDLNGEKIDHTLLYFQKIGALYHKYPRRAGIPAKKPLG